MIKKQKMMTLSNQSHVGSLHKSVLLLGVALVFLTCGVSNDPREVADAFCFRYFIELDQVHALEIASGLAADKLRKEIELLKGAARDFQEGEREFHQHKPFIDYKMTQRTDQDADHVMFLYHLVIEPKQGGKMEREILVSTVRENGRWRVNNYENYR
jgi:hypothetical protein